MGIELVIFTDLALKRTIKLWIRGSTSWRKMYTVFAVQPRNTFSFDAFIFSMGLLVTFIFLHLKVVKILEKWRTCEGKDLFVLFIQNSICRAPIEPGKKFSIKTLKFSISQELGSFNQKKKDSIDRVPIEDQSNQAEPSLKNLRNFRSVEKHTQLIEILEKLNFWKTAKVLCIKHSNQLISWMKCMSMSLKVFQ